MKKCVSLYSLCIFFSLVHLENHDVSVDNSLFVFHNPLVEVLWTLTILLDNSRNFSPKYFFCVYIAWILLCVFVNSFYLHYFCTIVSDTNYSLKII